MKELPQETPGWIHMKFDHVSINNQLKNGLRSSRLDTDEIQLVWPAQARLGLARAGQACWAGGSWGPSVTRYADHPPSTGWIYMKVNDFLIKTQLKNGLKSSRLDSYEI